MTQNKRRIRERQEGQQWDHFRRHCNKRGNRPGHYQEREWARAQLRTYFQIEPTGLMTCHDSLMSSWKGDNIVSSWERPWWMGCLAKLSRRRMRGSHLWQEQGKEGMPSEGEEFGVLKNRKEPVWMERNEQREHGMKRGRVQTVIGFNLSFKSQATIDLVGSHFI